MIKEFSLEAVREWGNGTVEQLHCGHCILSIYVVPHSGACEIRIYRIGVSSCQTGTYDKTSKNWKLKALVDAFKHYDTDEDKAVLAQVVTWRMFSSEVDLSDSMSTRFGNAYTQFNED